MRPKIAAVLRRLANRIDPPHERVLVVWPTTTTSGSVVDCHWTVN